MYSGYATTALALRAKSSLYTHRCCSHQHYHHHQSLCCCCCNYNISYGVPVNPRLISSYYFFQSRLMNWAPRRFLFAALSYRSIDNFWDAIDSLANRELGYVDVNLEENMDLWKKKKKNKKQKKKKKDWSSEEYCSGSSENLSSDFDVEKGRCRRSGGESKCKCSRRGDEYEKEKRVRKSRRGGAGGASRSRWAYECEVSDENENEELEDSGRYCNKDLTRIERSAHRRRDSTLGVSENFRGQKDSREGYRRLLEVNEDYRKKAPKFRDYNEEAREQYTGRDVAGRDSKFTDYDEGVRECYTRAGDRGRLSKSSAYDEEVREGVTRRDDRGRVLRGYNEEVSENHTRRGGRGKVSKLIDYSEDFRENHTRRADRGRDYNEDVKENYTRREEKGRSSELKDYNEEVREDYTRRNDMEKPSKFTDYNEVVRVHRERDSRKTASTSEIHQDYCDSVSWRRNSADEAREEHANKLVTCQRDSLGGSQQVIRKSEVDDRKRNTRLKGQDQSEKDVYINEERVSLARRDPDDVSQRSTRRAEVHEAHKKMFASTSNVVNSALVSKEEGSASSLSRIRDQTIERASNQEHSNISEISDDYVNRAFLSRMKFDETRVKDRENAVVEVTRDKKTRLNIKEDENIDVNLEYETHANLSSFHSTNTRDGNIQETQTYDKKQHSSTVNKVHGRRQELYQTVGQLDGQKSSTKEADKNAPQFQLARSNTRRISTYQETAGSVSEETSNKKVGSQEQCSSQAQRKFSRSSSGRTSNFPEQSNRTVENQEENLSLDFAQDSNIDTVKESMVNETNAKSGQSQTVRRGSLSGGSLSTNRSTVDANNQGRSGNINQIEQGVLESARRSEKSSMQHVEEFVEKLQQELSASDVLSSPSIQYKHTDEGEKSHSSSMQLAGLAVTPENKDGVSIQDSERQSSSMSEQQEPSGNMWIATSLSSEEQAKREELEEENSTDKYSKTVTGGTETAIARREPRSLWAYIAHIIRMGWRTKDSTQSPTPLSSRQSSPAGFQDSEAWFSGNEPDDNDVIDKRKQAMSLAAGLSKSKSDPLPAAKVGLDEEGEGMEELLEGSTSALASSKSRDSTSEGSSMRPKNEVGFSETDLATSMSYEKGGLSSEGPYAVTGLGHVNLGEIEIDQQVIPVGIGTFGEPALTGTTSFASAPEIITEIEKPGSASAKFAELKGGEVPDISGPVARIGELKQRNLQRNKQVLREQFDEWEEAYKQETEQQKIDEFFMREALLEAKKAADRWEVPVGAVLVQNGKIIARGCNLVEELRDSTAHAEMICIREASNLLRTWRLADATLYVTLEPCPMCAGAILQARIDTVVWGAPNKLLGADGSWVRLFPGNGGSDLDSSNQTAGPVHPFHTKITVRRGVLSNECANAMQQFFQLRRRKDRKPDASPPSCLPLAAHRPKFFTRIHNMLGITFGL